ncbi:hypothetical protein BAV2944 [Bordetella avium 197N]|uniref:Uncharacterized protein n=1 Tax=Bordetella avium (strain 197N) TaxID=360910 RepID=Q2KV42_BORA1|nr:hypothetical protein BAV2944 [Bordetella avium 197N]
MAFIFQSRHEARYEPALLRFENNCRNPLHSMQMGML